MLQGLTHTVTTYCKAVRPYLSCVRTVVSSRLAVGSTVTTCCKAVRQYLRTEAMVSSRLAVGLIVTTGCEAVRRYLCIVASSQSAVGLRTMPAVTREYYCNQTAGIARSSPQPHRSQIHVRDGTSTCRYIIIR